jgi:hypothetical protein
MFDAQKRRFFKGQNPQHKNYCPLLNRVSHGNNYNLAVISVRECELIIYIQISFQQTSNNNTRHANINHHLKASCYSKLRPHQPCAQRQRFCNQQPNQKSLPSAIHYLDLALPSKFRNVSFSFSYSKSVSKHAYSSYSCKVPPLAVISNFLTTRSSRTCFHKIYWCKEATKCTSLLMSLWYRKLFVYSPPNILFT